MIVRNQAADQGRQVGNVKGVAIDSPVQIKDLLQKFIRWVFGQSKQVKESRAREDYCVPGLRLLRLDRRSARAVSTWCVYCYAEGYNLELGCEDLRHIDGVESIQKKYALSSHLINVVKIYYEVEFDPKTQKRRPRKEVLLSAEACLEATYSSSSHDWAPTIFDSTCKFLIKLNADGTVKYPVGSIDWEDVFTQSARYFLSSQSHVVFPIARPPAKR